MKLTDKRIREFIKDEKAGAKAYSKFGLPGLAKDERRHRAFLIKLQRKL